MYQIIAKDFSGNDCAVSVVSLISDAVRVFWAVGFAVDLVDASSGEVLMSRFGTQLVYSIFAMDPFDR